jgi:Putative adhesin
MNVKLKKFLKFTAIDKTTILLSVVFFFASFAAQDIFAQKRFSKTYPASKNVRLQLTNRTGTVTVEGWDKDQIQISAYLEAPAANIVPQSLSGMILINVVKDNQGRNDVGNVNFNIKVPQSSTVDIETRMGNLNVSNLHGTLVRAHISSEGDITLTNIGADNVSAENVIGDIFYDGDIQSKGAYRFTSTRGNINLRIPFNSSFRLIATAPSTRNISLGEWSGGNLNFVLDGRRVVGQTGDGSASITVTNQRGSISFIRR